MIVYPVQVDAPGLPGWPLALLSSRQSQEELVVVYAVPSADDRDSLHALIETMRRAGDDASLPAIRWELVLGDPVEALPPLVASLAPSAVILGHPSNDELAEAMRALPDLTFVVAGSRNEGTPGPSCHTVKTEEARSDLL